jgi:hypothetical protein
MSNFFWSSTSSTDPTATGNWTNAADGTTTAVPTTGDNVFISSVPGATLANIEAATMASITLATLTISSTYGGTIGGTGTTSPFGYWEIGATAWSIGNPSSDGNQANGSGRIKINFGTIAFSGVVVATGQSIDTGFEPVRILGANSGNVLEVQSGLVGVATNLPGEDAQLSAVNIIGGTCDLGAGVTLASATASGNGNLNSACAITTLTTAAGTNVTASGAVEIATANVYGNVYFNNRPGSGDAVGTLNIYNGGDANFAGNPAACTVGTVNVESGFTITLDPAANSSVTLPALTRSGIETLSGT